MKKLILYSVIIISSCSMIFIDAISRTYEPPINLFFIIHIEPMDWGTGTTYDERMEKLEILMDMISRGIRDIESVAQILQTFYSRQ